MSTGLPSSSGSTVSAWSSSADLRLTGKCYSDFIKLMICFLRGILVFYTQEQQPQSLSRSTMYEQSMTSVKSSVLLKHLNGYWQQSRDDVVKGLMLAQLGRQRSMWKFESVCFHLDVVGRVRLKWL